MEYTLSLKKSIGQVLPDLKNDFKAYDMGKQFLDTILQGKFTCCILKTCSLLSSELKANKQGQYISHPIKRAL